jgi:hypothetical protein
MIKPSRPEIINWKLNVAKNQGSGPKPKVTFDMLFDKYSKQKAVTSDRPLKKDEITNNQGGSSSPPRAATRLKGESSQQGQRFTPPWASLLTVDFGTPSYKFTVNICTYLIF